MTTFSVLNAPEDLFGLERLAAEPASFAAPGAEPEPAVWRVDLDADLDQAAAQLEAGLRQVTAAAGALGQAEARLQALAQPGAAVSFAAGETPAPEQEALDALDRLRAPVSFAAGEEAEDETPARFAALLDRLTSAVRYAAVIETRVAGRLAARTALTWAADADTFWPAEAAPELLALHARTLRLSLASRAALLKILLTAAQGAVKLAGVLALPGGALLALPVAWKFINQVLAEAGRYQEAQRSLQGA